MPYYMPTVLNVNGYIIKLCNYIYFDEVFKVNIITQFYNISYYQILISL